MKNAIGRLRNLALMLWEFFSLTGESLQVCRVHSKSQTATKTFANKFDSLKQFFMSQRTFLIRSKYQINAPICIKFVKKSLTGVKSCDWSPPTLTFCFTRHQRQHSWWIHTCMANDFLGGFGHVSKNGSTFVPPALERLAFPQPVVLRTGAPLHTRLVWGFAQLQEGVLQSLPSDTHNGPVHMFKKNDDEL